MSILDFKIQQPNERWDYDFQYTMEEGDSITTATVTVDPAGLSVTAAEVDNVVKIWVEGGVAGVEYKVEVLVTTALGRKKEDELIILVEDL